MKNAIYMLSLTLAICSCSSKAKNQTETTKANLENPESASITKIDFAKEFSKKDLEAKKNIQIFQDGYKLLQDKKWDESISAFQKQLLVKNNLEEYSRFYLAQAYFEKSEWELSKSELEKVLKLSPNVKMQLDANNLLGEISLQKKNYKEAKNYLQKIEKRTRNTESYQQTIYNLAAAEKGLKNFRQMCRWLTKIYIQYPNFEKTQDWGADLSSNLFMNEPTRCKTEISDFRSRMKSLLRSGLDKKAQVEIDSLKKNLMKSDPYIADQIQAQFYLQEGEVQKTLDILKPYREEKKYDFSYLMQLAVAAARIGDVQLSVSTYYSAYRLSPGSKLARQALYQSAFLSYQFQDYEGATKRFQEFIKVYRNSSLVKDVQWHLAWLKYLQKDYTGSYKSFAELLQKKSSRRKNARVAPPDRINYWMAMSLFRQGKYEPAKAIFEKLSKDKLLGYYSVAAQSRLDKIALLIPLQQAEKNKQDENKIIYHSNLPTQPLVISRFSASEFLLPSIDDGFSSDGNIESEEDYVISELDQQDQESTDTADLENGTEQDSVEVAENETVSFSSPVLMARFERARDLMIAGFDEWARWDLYDIERKTSNREYLRTLMNEYS
ncbi:MAG: tetratricopeptide repeat protein, partial [Pseudobdellovibrionaceae bacterium]